MYLWGRDWSRSELEQRIGSLSQLGGIARFEYCDGKARGVTALRVKTASGFEFSVLPERGLDIFEATYQGRSLSWHSPVGVMHPGYYDPRGLEWLKTFAGGLLTSCGLSAAGSPSEDHGEQLGLHGSISTTPAEQVNWWQEWENDELLMTISGKIREARVFGPNLVANRTIKSSLAGRFIRLEDRIVNEGNLITPLMLVYHCNFGFPLLTDRSRIYCPSQHVEGRTDFAKLHKESWNVFEPPVPGIEERVYYHEMAPDEHGNVRVLLVSDDATRDFGVEITYTAATLPRFVEWKMTGQTHFVLGLEPANCKVDGRKAERDSGTLCFLKPGEEKQFGLELRVLAGSQEVSEAIQRQSA
jgi:hypothetical protein